MGPYRKQKDKNVEVKKVTKITETEKPVDPAIAVTTVKPGYTGAPKEEKK
jgi:hypothetical protein